MVRHGETTWNVEGRYQGQFDSELTEVGRHQARALAGRFAGERFSTLYSSDLGRARETAEVIAARTGHSIVPDPRLRERSLGVFQGLHRVEAMEKLPEDHQKFLSEDWEYAPPDGESTSQSVERFYSGLSELAHRHPGETIAVVTHGGVLGGFLRRVLGISPDRPRRFKRYNASWNVFSFDGERWMLDTWGDISHVEETRSLDD